MKIFFIILTAGLAASTFSARVSMDDIMNRAYSRQFPSLFQTWGPLVDESGTKDTLELAAEHDLMFNAPWFYGLEWDSPDSFRGEATTFKEVSVAQALIKRSSLLELNPNIILIGEVRYFDAQNDYLPEDSPYWKRDDNGNRIVNESQGWENPYYYLDPDSKVFQTHVGNQCKALLETGVVDGCMLDWAKDERIELFQEVRRIVGDDAVLMGNVNSAVTVKISPLLNAVFMESSPNWIENFWHETQKSIIHNQANLREPKLICLELWPDDNSGIESQDQLSHMRAGTSLSLTHSNGYFMYYPDQGKYGTGQTYYDHLHKIYPFWNEDLGKPMGLRDSVDGAYIRRFSNGSAVYNPDGNSAVTITFTTEHESQATGTLSLSHTVNGYDGDIFFNPNPVRVEQPVTSSLVIDLMPGKFSLQLKGSHRVQVTDTRGKVVFSGSGHGNMEFMLPRDLTAGIYFITVRAKEFTTTEKLVIMAR